MNDVTTTSRIRRRQRRCSTCPRPRTVRTRRPEAPCAGCGRNDQLLVVRYGRGLADYEEALCRTCRAALREEEASGRDLYDAWGVVVEEETAE